MTEKLDCAVAADLLPLYIDDACSVQSKELVEKHLEACEACRATLAEMKTELPAAMERPPMQEKQVLAGIFKKVLQIFGMLLLIIACAVVNLNVSGPGMEGDAVGVNLIMTILYIGFWSIFCYYTRHYKPFQMLCLVVALLTLVSSLLVLAYHYIHIDKLFGMVWHWQLGFLSAVPFYGLRLFFQWDTIYIIAGALSLMMAIFAAINIDKTKSEMERRV